MKTLKLLKKLKKSLKGQYVKLPSPETVAVLIADFVWIHGSYEEALKFKKEFFLNNYDEVTAILNRGYDLNIIKKCILEEKHAFGCHFIDFTNLAMVIVSISLKLFNQDDRERFYKEMSKQF